MRRTSQNKIRQTPWLGSFQQRGNKGETAVIRHGRGVLLVLISPLVSGDRSSATANVVWGGRSKGKSANPPKNLVGANNAATKEKPQSSFIYFSPLVFVCKDKADFCPRTWHLFPCENYFTSPLYGAMAATHLFHPSSLCDLKPCAWWSYFNFIDIMINDSIWNTMLSNLTLLLSFFITNYQIRKKIFKWSIITESRISKENYYWKVINLQSIKSIKEEGKFGKISILT